MPPKFSDAAARLHHFVQQIRLSPRDTGLVMELGKMFWEFHKQMLAEEMPHLSRTDLVRLYPYVLATMLKMHMDKDMIEQMTMESGEDWPKSLENGEG